MNLAIFSRNATGVRLDLFASPDDAAPQRSFILDAARNKTGDIWHVWLAGVRPGQLYGYRIAGPYAPHEGHRFNPNKLVLDPYATAIAVVPGGDLRAAVGYDPSSPQGDLAFSEVDVAADAPKCVVTQSDFDWRGDQPLRTPATETVIYELHVRGFTIDPRSGVRFPGTYRGLVEKIPHLKDLGVTAVELMPVTEFDERLIARHDPLPGAPLRNYWGYDPLGFFAPKASYAATEDRGLQVLEFKEMVRSFHRAGLEVILDVVYDTVEGSELGPMDRDVLAAAVGGVERPLPRRHPSLLARGRRDARRVRQPSLRESLLYGARIRSSAAAPSAPRRTWCGSAPGAVGLHGTTPRRSAWGACSATRPETCACSSTHGRRPCGSRCPRGGGRARLTQQGPRQRRTPRTAMLS